MKSLSQEDASVVTFYSNKLNWQAWGYSAPPTPPDDAELRLDPDYLLWLRLQEIVGEAKSGVFSNLPEVISLYNKAQTAVFGYVASRVLGDAGTTVCFQHMKHELDTRTEIEPNKVIHYCNAFSTFGALSYVPVILTQFLILRRSDIEAAILPIYLSWMLEDDWGPVAKEPLPEGFSEYQRLVMEHYERLKEKYKTDNVLVFKGKLWGVRSLARLFLERNGDNNIDNIPIFHFRRRFEASTGVNCTSFYNDNGFQPLTAAAIVEEFLESPEAAKYQEGLRYFFGHRIPE